jgi:chromosome partitioning protein
MSQITTITNQKGGVGKTTTSHALATGLKIKGRTVLVIDIDPQANITYTMSADEDQTGTYEVLQGIARDIKINIRDVIQKTTQGDIISSSLNLSGADMEFNVQGREYLLKESLLPLSNTYDHIIIDTPPTLGILTINALTASNDVIIPMGAEALSMKGLGQLYRTIQRTRKHSNPSLKISGLLLTRYNARTVLAQELKKSIIEHAQAMGSKVFNTVIREGIAIKEAQTNRTNIFDYAPNSNPAIDYTAFIDEYLQGEK